MPSASPFPLHGDNRQPDCASRTHCNGVRNIHNCLEYHVICLKATWHNFVKAIIFYPRMSAFFYNTVISVSVCERLKLLVELMEGVGQPLPPVNGSEWGEVGKRS